MVNLRSSPSGRSYDLASSLVPYGEQDSWTIDPATGDDDNPGTTTHPLRTMEEFNARLCGVLVRQATTLQLVGNVTDQPLNLVGTRFALNASLTVNGTRTLVGAGVISSVTAIGVSGTTYPWQLATTGIDWTSVPVNSQILLQGGQVAFIRNVIDANTIVVGAMTILGSTTVFTPTASLSFTVSTLSTALPPVINVSAQTNGSNLAIAVTLQNLVLGSGNYANGGVDVGMRIQGCDLQFPAFANMTNAGGLMQMLSCRITCTVGTPTARSGPNRLAWVACSFVASSLRSFSMTGAGDHTFASCSFYTVQLFPFGANVQVQSGGLHFENVNTTRVLQLDADASVFCNGATAIINGRNCASTFGIDVTVGRLYWSVASCKPTLGIASGCTNDLRLGSIVTATYTYAALGLGKTNATLDAIPPTVTTLVGTGSASAFQVF